MCVLTFSALVVAAGDSRMLTLVELQHVRQRLAEEMDFFEDTSTTNKEKSRRLLFLFMKDLMDGLNGGYITECDINLAMRLLQYKLYDGKSCMYIWS